MARRRRSRIRSVNLRFVAVAVLILGLVALVVNGVVSAAQSSTSYEVLTNQSFVLQANTITSAQSVQGQQLSELLANAPGMGRKALEQQLNALVMATATSSQQAAIAQSPGPSGGVGPKFAVIVDQRAQAVASIQKAFTGLLGLMATPGTSGSSALLSSAQATQLLTQAGSMLTAADDAFPPLRRTLLQAPGHARLHHSSFVSDAGLLTESSMSVLVSALASSPTLTVIHQLTLASVSLQPSPLPVGGAAQSVTLPPTSSLVITVVVRNQGNVGENPVSVTASTTPLQGGIPGTSRATTSVASREAVSVQLNPIRVVPGSTLTLSISVAPAPGQTDRSGLTQTYNVTVAPSSVTTTTLKP